MSHESQDDDEVNIDIYGDINIEMGLEENNPNEEFGITSSPARLNRSDSILDIHATVDFEETDLPESETEAAQTKQTGSGANSTIISIDETFVTLPEPSKWEREDDTVTEKRKFQFHFEATNHPHFLWHSTLNISLPFF